MLDKIKTYVIGALLLLVIGQFVYNDITNAKKEQQLLDQRNKIASLSNIVKEDSSTFSRLIQESSNQKDQNNLLAKENIKLKQKIKNIESSVVIQVVPESIKVTSKNLALGDSISQVVDTSKTPERIKVKFNLGTKNPIYSLNGFTLTNPPEAEISVLLKPFKAFYIINQNEDYTWKATVGFQTLDGLPMPFNVTSINGEVNPKLIKEGSIYNWGFGTSISQYKLAPGVLLKADKNIFIFNYKIIDQLSNSNQNQWYNRIEISYFRLLFQ